MNNACVLKEFAHFSLASLLKYPLYVSYKSKIQLTPSTLISDPVTLMRRPTNYAAITSDGLDI